MNQNIDMSKILKKEMTNDEELIYYYMAYNGETDKNKKILLLKKLQKLIERNNENE